MGRFTRLGIAAIVIAGIIIASAVLQSLNIGKEKRPLPNIQLQTLDGALSNLSNLPQAARVIHIFDSDHHELALLARALNSANYNDIDYRFLAVQTDALIANQLAEDFGIPKHLVYLCLLYTSPSPRDQRGSRMPSSA